MPGPDQNRWQLEKGRRVGLRAGEGGAKTGAPLLIDAKIEHFTLSHTFTWTPLGLHMGFNWSLSGVTAMKSPNSWSPHGLHFSDHVELQMYLNGLHLESKVHIDSMWNSCGVHQESPELSS